MIKKPLTIEEKILSPLIEAKAYPESGHGEIRIFLQSHKVVCIKKEETIKLG